MSNTPPTPRYHEIDALRSIALVLLIVYHIFAAYQPFADKLRFIRYELSLEQWWFVGDALNIWRIPVLFFISGMALHLVLRRRSVGETYLDRMMRLVLPLLVVTFIIGPLSPVLYSLFHDRPWRYQPNPGHLWFVQNLITYTVLALPLICWVKKRPENILIRGLRATLPVSLFLVLAVPLVVETLVFDTKLFAFFPFRPVYGFICYLVGFLLLSTGDKFWSSIRRSCHIALPIAAALYLVRKEFIDIDWLPTGPATTAVESAMWMLAFIGYGSLFLRRPLPIFAYLNSAVFPIYIIHMLAQQSVALLIYPWQLPAGLTFLLHIVLTLGLCLAVYHFIIRPVRWLHPFLGISRAGESQKATRIALAYVIAPLIVFLQLSFTTLAYAKKFRTSSHTVPAPTSSSPTWLTHWVNIDSGRSVFPYTDRTASLVIASRANSEK